MFMCDIWGGSGRTRGATEGLNNVLIGLAGSVFHTFPVCFCLWSGAERGGGTSKVRDAM